MRFFLENYIIGRSIRWPDNTTAPVTVPEPYQLVIHPSFSIVLCSSSQFPNYSSTLSTSTIISFLSPPISSHLGYQMAETPDNSVLLERILATLCQIQGDNKVLAASIDAMNGRVNALADVKKLKDAVKVDTPLRPVTPASKPVDAPFSPTTDIKDEDSAASKRPATSRIILTTYPGQSGIDPIIMNWGHEDPMQRGPVVVSRAGSTVRRRNG